MEGRALPKTLTRRERIDRCHIRDEDIPEEFLDTGLTFDIMEEAGEVDGKVLDLRAVKLWQQNKVTEALKKTPPPPPEEIQQISQINAFTTCPFKSYIFLKELDQRIEAWVRDQEYTYNLFKKIDQQKQERENHLAKLKEQEQFINEKIHLLTEKLQVTQDETVAQTILDEMATILHQKDKLPEKKDKLARGNHYYSDPAVINHKIDKLCAKLKSTHLSDEERNSIGEKLSFWTKRLEARHARPAILYGARTDCFRVFGLANIMNAPNIAKGIASPFELDRKEESPLPAVYRTKPED